MKMYGWKRNKKPLAKAGTIRRGVVYVEKRRYAFGIGGYAGMQR